MYQPQFSSLLHRSSILSRRSVSRFSILSWFPVQSKPKILSQAAAPRATNSAFDYSPYYFLPTTASFIRSSSNSLGFSGKIKHFNSLSDCLLFQRTPPFSEAKDCMQPIHPGSALLEAVAACETGSSLIRYRVSCQLKDDIGGATHHARDPRECYLYVGGIPDFNENKDTRSMRMAMTAVGEFLGMLEGLLGELEGLETDELLRMIGLNLELVNMYTQCEDAREKIKAAREEKECYFNLECDPKYYSYYYEAEESAKAAVDQVSDKFEAVLQKLEDRGKEALKRAMEINIGKMKHELRYLLEYNKVEHDQQVRALNGVEVVVE